MPEKFAPGSTKFSLRLDRTLPLVPGSCPALTRYQGALPQELSAYDIMRTCHRIHDIMDGDNLFHAENNFEFCNTRAMLNYLVALPSSRRNAIRSIKVKYDYHGIPGAAFLMLAVCHGLKHLSLDIFGMTNFFNPYLTHFSQAPGYQQLMALRGLNSLNLVHGSQSWSVVDEILARLSNVWDSGAKADSEQAVLAVIRQLERDIRQATTQKRTLRPLIGIGELTFAMNEVDFIVPAASISDALRQPGQINSGLSPGGSQTTAQGAHISLIPMVQPILSEEEQWREIDRTNLASWDV